MSDEELLREMRNMNSILLLAFGKPIEDRVRSLVSQKPRAVVMQILSSSGAIRTEALEEAAKKQGVARSTMYKAIGELERFGVIERPKRGVLALSDVASAFVASGVLTTAGPGSSSQSDDAQT